MEANAIAESTESTQTSISILETFSTIIRTRMMILMMVYGSHETLGELFLSTVSHSNILYICVSVLGIWSTQMT